MKNPNKQDKTYPAIALLELNNVPVGIAAADAMVKKSPIAMLKSGTVSQGKYLILVGGTTAAVDEAYHEGMRKGGASVVDSLLLPDVDPQVHRAILGHRQPCDREALGILETHTVASIIEAADAGVKGAEVRLVELRLADGFGGKGYTLFTGKLEEVQAAMNLASQRIQERQVITFHQIIPQLHPELAREIESGMRFSHSARLDLPDGEAEG